MYLWEDDDKKLLEEWIRENVDTFVSSNTHHPELGEIFPHKSPSQIYHQLYRMRKKLNLPRTHPRKISSTVPRSDLWNHEEIELLQSWIKQNPEIIPSSTLIPPSLRRKLIRSRRSGSAIYKKWKVYRDLMINGGEVNQASTVKRNGIDIVKILNAAFESAIQAYMIDQDELERLRSENAELKTQLVKLTDVREAVENFQKAVFPPQRGKQ